MVFLSRDVLGCELGLLARAGFAASQQKPARRDAEAIGEMAPGPWSGGRAFSMSGRLEPFQDAS
jgi:hypothetical protein